MPRHHDIILKNHAPHKAWDSNQVQSPILKKQALHLGNIQGQTTIFFSRFAASDSTLFGASVQLKKFDKELFPPFFKS